MQPGLVQHSKPLQSRSRAVGRLTRVAANDFLQWEGNVAFDAEVRPQVEMLGYPP